MENLFEWFWKLMQSIGSLWDWLITPISILGYDVAPIYLVGGAMITAGVIRAIIGIV